MQLQCLPGGMVAAAVLLAADSAMTDRVSLNKAMTKTPLCRTQHSSFTFVKVLNIRRLVGGHERRALPSQFC